MSSMRLGFRPLSVFALAALSSGCGLLLGLDDFEEGPAGGTTTSGTSTGGMGTGGMGTGGTGGGCDGGPSCSCVPDTTMACESGLPGVCAAGKQTCKVDGAGYGACVPGVAKGAMAEVCTAKGDEDCDGIACSECDWSLIAAGVNYQSPRSMAIDAMGNILVAGWFDGTLKLKRADGTFVTLNTAGAEDYFLAKFDPSGNVLWGKSFGDVTANGYDIAVAVDAKGNVGIAGALDGSASFSDNATVTAIGGPDIFAVKYDSLGNHLWTKTFGAAAAHIGKANTVAFDTAGNMLLGGRSEGSILVGATTFSSNGTLDAFIVKLSGMTGVPIWAKQYKENGGVTGNQGINRIVVDGGNNIYAAGYVIGSIYLAGNSVAPNAAAGFVAKIDSSGGVSWARYVDSAGNDNARDLAVDTSGSVVVTGTVGGSVEFGGGLVIASGATSYSYLAKYSSIGILSGAKIFASSGGGAARHSDGYGVTTDMLDNIYLTGNMHENLDLGGGVLANGGPGSGSSDIFLGKFDALLTPVWSKHFGDSQGQSATALSHDASSNRLVLVALSEGSVDFGTGALAVPDPGTTVLSLAKFQP